MNYAAEFKKAFLPGSRWIRTNHVNPKASAPMEVSVLKTTPQEAVLQAGDQTWILTWPHRLQMTVNLDPEGWHIYDSKGRKIVTYKPIEGQSIVGASESIVDYLLNEAPDFERQGRQVVSPEGRLRDLTVKQVKPNIVIFYATKETILKPAGWVMMYFMDSEQAARDMKADKIDYPVFLPGSLSMRMSGYSMIDAIWNKRKSLPGETPEAASSREAMRHVVGALEAYKTDKGIFVDNLSVRPGWKKNTIGTKLMQALENSFPGLPIDHSAATEAGHSFLKKTGYLRHDRSARGGEHAPAQENVSRILDYLLEDNNFVFYNIPKNPLTEKALEMAARELIQRYYDGNEDMMDVARELAEKYGLTEYSNLAFEDIISAMYSLFASGDSSPEMGFNESEDEEGWIGVDFDGTLAKHTTGEYRSEKVGKPVPKMVARVRRWVGRGKKVKIFTARADDEKAVNAIKKWLKDNELPDLEVTNLKDHRMIEVWDDKAVAVEKNTGEVKESCIVEFLLNEDWEPDENIMNWFRNMLATLKLKGIWGIPATGQVFEIDQVNKTATLIRGSTNDPDGWYQKTKIVFQRLGYTVYGDEAGARGEQAFGENLLIESPEISTLKKHTRQLTPEERATVMKAGAVWHHGPNGEATPAIRKSVVKGKTYYWCATHRFGQVRNSLQAAIKTFPAVEETS